MPPGNLSTLDVGGRYLVALRDVFEAERDLGRIQAQLAKQREAESEAFSRKAAARSALHNLEVEVLEHLAREAGKV